MKSKIELYIESQSSDKIDFLKKLYETIKEVLPECEERIAWSMPSFWDEKHIIQFQAFNEHTNVYVEPQIIDMFKEDYTDFTFTKRGLSLPYDKELPRELIQSLALTSHYYLKDNI